METAARPIVLIVEDEQLIRMITADQFEDEGFEVLEADCAQDALRMHREHQGIQLLFTDVNMPGEFDGIDLAEQMKLSAPGLCVMIASALPMPRPVQHIPAVFIAKPYDAHAVCVTARGLLAH